MMIYTLEYQDRVIGYYKTWELATKAIPRFAKYYPTDEIIISWVRVNTTVA